MFSRFVEQGYAAFERGVVTNPFPDNYKNFERHRDWQFGWNKAFYENRERVIEQESGGGSDERSEG